MKFPKKIQDFLEKPNFMILGTHNPNDSIHMTMVWYVYEDGLFKVSTTTHRVKFRNIKDNPDVSVLIPDKDDNYKFFSAYGTVEKHTTKGGHDMIDRLAKRYLGEDTYPYDPEREQERVTLFIKPKGHFNYGL